MTNKNIQETISQIEIMEKDLMKFKMERDRLDKDIFTKQLNLKRIWIETFGTTDSEPRTMSQFIKAVNKLIDLKREGDQ